MAPPGTGYCINCGATLETDHRFCWNCGAARWTPPADQAAAGSGQPPAPEQRPPPTPGTPVFSSRPPALEQAASLGLLPWFYAAGAILFLVEGTEALAALASPDGRAQALADLSRQGVPASMQMSVLVLRWVIVIGGSAVAAVLHGAAFYGLRRLRRWGWVSALVVAAIWSLVIVGIPVLVRLVNRNVRQAFGVD